MKKRILYVSSETTLGGASQSLCDMLSYLRQYVNPIVIIPGTGKLENRLKEMGIKYYVVKISRGYGKIGDHTIRNEESDFIINYQAAYEIKKIIMEEEILLVHINSSVCNAGAMGAVLAGIPYIWHLREIPENQFGCEFWDKELKQLLFDKADGFIAISKCVHDDFYSKYRIESATMYNGINYKRFFKDTCNKNVENHNFILAGIVSEAKGQLEAIEAVKILKNKGVADIHLFIVGSYSLRFEWCLKKYISQYALEENITLYPFLMDLAQLREKCAYSLTTSKFEALGRVTIEAMLAGNIVIGANTAGTLEIIGNDQQKGYLYREGSPESLAEMMLCAIKENKSQKQRMLERAQKYAISEFDINKYVNNINKLYEKVLKKPKIKDVQLLHYLEDKYSDCKKIQVGLKKNESLVSKSERIKQIERLWDCTSNKINDRINAIANKSIAIYGMGKLGYRLYDELENEGLKVSFVIDRNTYFLDEIMDVYSPDENIPRIDILIVTPIDDEVAIKEKFRKDVNEVIIGIEEYLNFNDCAYDSIQRKWRRK